MKARNQFAHCHWSVEGNFLWFGNLEKGSEGPEEVEFPFKPINHATLAAQEEYFGYVHRLLVWLYNEHAVRAGKLTTIPSKFRNECLSRLSTIFRRNLNPRPKPKLTGHFRESVIRDRTPKRRPVGRNTTFGYCGVNYVIRI